jgi:hypothetical protein
LILGEGRGAFGFAIKNVVEAQHCENISNK